MSGRPRRRGLARACPAHCRALHTPGVRDAVPMHYRCRVMSKPAAAGSVPPAAGRAVAHARLRRRRQAPPRRPGACLAYAPVSDGTVDLAQISDTTAQEAIIGSIFALYASTTWRPVVVLANTAAACPRPVPTSGFTGAASSPASASPTTRPSAAGRASWSRRRLRRLHHFDPRWKSPSSRPRWRSLGQLLGLNALRASARWTAGKPFDYDKPVDGLRRCRATCVQPASPRATFASLQLTSPTIRCRGWMAREVVERYGGEVGGPPWAPAPSAGRGRRSSQVVLERKPVLPRGLL